MAESTAPVLFEKSGPVALITLNRPQAHNALTPEMLCLLADAFVEYRDDADLRAAIITGSGAKAFCAGGDLGLTLPLLGGSRAPQTAWDHRVLQEPLVMQASSLRDFDLDKPVIAALNGVCLAAGMELTLGTDIRIASDHAMFGLPEVTRALIPFAGSMVRLPRQIPYPIAMEMLLTGRPISAADAMAHGLVNKVVAADKLMDTALEYAHAISKNGPLALRAVKSTIRQAHGLPLTQGYALEDQARAAVFASEDAIEGPRAFMEKRPPVYKGR